MPEPGQAALSDGSAQTQRDVRRRRRGHWVVAATWFYTVVVLTALALISWVGEAWWGVTVLLFVPRWLFLGPVAALALASAWARKPSLWATQGAIALLVAGPLMAVSIPIQRLWAPRVEGIRFRVLTFNRSMDPIDARRLIRLIEHERIDLICFQEGLKGDPTLDAYLARSWHRDRKGFVASRYPIISEMDPLPSRTAIRDQGTARLTRVRIRTGQGVEFILASVHMPTIRPGFNLFLAGDIGGLQTHIEWWADELERVVQGLAELRDTPFLVGGDFNMPSDDSKMASLRGALRFAFEEAGWGYGYTRPTRYPWFRIDHIMASPQWHITRSWVGEDCGSDHLPLLAEVVLPHPARGTNEAPH